LKNTYTLLGWDISYFTGKIRGYLRHKGIPFTERPMNLLEFRYLAPRKTGAAAMPVLITPEGHWLQDSSVIFDTLERRHGAPHLLPDTARQRFLAYLLELWGDEFWIPAAMHTRWSHPENLSRFQQEAGTHLLPHFPQFLQERASNMAASSMRRHLPSLGILPEQTALLDRWINLTLDRLEAHFAQHRYLLGEKPSLADFSLAGPLYAHLATDPWSRRELIVTRPQVFAYVERMSHPPSKKGDYLPEDRIPETLIPLVADALREMAPWITATLVQVQEFLATHPKRKTLPRGLGMIEFPLANGVFRRIALPYVLWMVQRLNQMVATFSATERESVAAFLRTWDAECWLSLSAPRLERAGLTIRMTD
jgi:glutathione S-transferase